MTDIEPQSQSLTLELSVRDAQAVACMIELCAVMLTTYAREEDVQRNYDSMESLFNNHYSEREWDALRHRTRALLPIGGLLSFSDPRLMQSSGSTVLQ